MGQRHHSDSGRRWKAIGVFVVAGALAAATVALVPLEPLPTALIVAGMILLGCLCLFGILAPKEASPVAHLPDDAGEAAQSASSYRQVTEQLESSMHDLKRMRASQALSDARARAVMDAAAEGIITLAPDWSIESINRAAARMFGYAPAELKGKNVFLLLPSTDPAGGDRDLIEYLSRSTFPVSGGGQEIPGRRRDGSTFLMELTVSSVQGAGGALFTATLRDLTRRKQAEEELRKARDAAEEANRAKRAFLARMSHELRTPLTVIIGCAEGLEEELQELEKTDMVAEVQKITRSGKHLLGLINEILDWAKIEAGQTKLHLETFDIQEMLTEVTYSIESLVKQNANTLRIETGPGLGTMHADRVKVRQVLVNLLSNACKFTSKGTIRLTASRADGEQAAQIVFAVADTGIGLKREQIGKLFRDFSQADESTTRKYGGTGLGLAISRQFCQMMGGDITVESEFGRGSTFTVRIPTTCGPRTGERGV